MNCEYGIPVKLENPCDVQEILLRMGIANIKEKVLWPSCHLIKVDEEFYVMHFKEAMLFEGSRAEFTEDDQRRRNKIVSLLENWNMVKLLNKEQIKDRTSNIFVLKASELNHGGWQIKPKYFPRRKKKETEN